MRESTANQKTARKEIEERGKVKLCCIPCLKTWEITDISSVDVIPDTEGMTMLCSYCRVDALVPVVPSSMLYGKTEEEQKRQLEAWRYAEFGFPPEEEEKTSCLGCQQGLANQEAHMDIGGCLYCD